MSLWSELTFPVVCPVTPLPTRPASITATVAPPRFKSSAAVSPAMPPPMTATSTSIASRSGG
jgi:hypothetical protein